MLGLTGSVEHDQGMLFLLQRLSKILRSKMADAGGFVLPRLLRRRRRLGTAEMKENKAVFTIDATRREKTLLYFHFKWGKKEYACLQLPRCFQKEKKC